MVKELRERTSLGMMECKKALVESSGDINQAIEALKKSGQLKAAKRSTRVASEGLIGSKSSAAYAVIVEVNCETDFVGRDANFRQFVSQVTDCAFTNSIKDVTSLLTQVLDDGTTIDCARLKLSAQLGENITVRRVTLISPPSGGSLAVYLHGGTQVARIGTAVALNITDQELAKDLAMQIAAMKPEYLSEAEVPQARLNKEREIFAAQAKKANSSKSDEILSKIISGKLKKFVKELTLVGQPFIKDSSQSVEQLLKNANATVTSYVRYEVGEGIEKQSNDFVSEVMSQARAN